MVFTPSTPPIKLSKKVVWALCLTLFMIGYNLSVIPPIMPLLARQLDTTIGFIQTALVLFSLVTASFAPTCENLCRFYGRNRIFLFGLILYGIGTTVTALSPDIGILVVSFSLFTGLAATPLVSAPWAMMDLAFEGKQAEQARLALIVSSSLGGLAGGVLGGWIASQIGWRWAFLPSLLILLFVLGWGRFLPQTTPSYRTPIDWIGGLVSFLGFGLILLGLSLAGEFGWWEPKRTLAIAGVIIPPFAISIVPTLISAGVICLGFFVFWQRQQAQKSGSSLLRIGLLRKPIFVVGMLTAMLHTLVTTGVQFNLFQILPVILALNPFQTAIAVLPYNLTMIIVIVVILKYLTLDQQVPPKYIVSFGLVLLSVGIWSLYLAITPTMTSFTLIPALIVMGMGSGFFLAYVSSLTYSVATPAEKPEGTGIYNPIQRLGNSLGRGILGTILVSFTSVQIVDRILQSLGQTLSPAQRQAAISSLERVIQTYSRTERREFFLENVPDAVKPELRDIVNVAALEGMKTALLVALALSLICFFLATVLPKSINRQKPIASQLTEPNAIEP